MENMYEEGHAQGCIGEIKLELSILSYSKLKDFLGICDRYSIHTHNYQEVKNMGREIWGHNGDREFIVQEDELDLGLHDSSLLQEAIVLFCEKILRGACFEDALEATAEWYGAEDVMDHPSVKLMLASIEETDDDLK